MPVRRFFAHAARLTFLTAMPVSAGLTLSASLGAQASRKPIPASRLSCFGALSVVAVKLVDHAGKPVNNARLELRQVAGNKLVGRIASPMDDQGDYALLDDVSAPGVAPLGEPFDLTIVRGARRTTVRLVIGLEPPQRCHVALLKGNALIRLE